MGSDGVTVVDNLFYINRFVDCFFVMDIFVQFHMSYFDPKQSRRVVQLSKIRNRYLHGWFTVDVVGATSAKLHAMAP